MAWFDELFAPPMFGQSTGLTPNTYDFFRALYPPHTRGMPEQPQMPYAPPMNPALPRPMQAPPPNEPRAGNGHPGAWTPGSLMPHNREAASIRDLINGAPIDGEAPPAPPPGGDLRVRFNKPNVMPASNPPPMMGRAGELPPGVNPPGAMGMGDLAYPGAMTMPASPAGPSWRERNKGWMEPLGDALTGLGQGIAATPPGSSPLTYLSQGTAMGAQNIERAQDRKLDRRYKEAQVGEKESAAEARKNALAFADTIKDPTARSYMKMGLTQKALERLEKIDPAEAARLIDFEVKKQEALLPGKMAVARAGKTDVTVALPKAETAAGKLLNDITRIKEQLAKDPENPTLKAALRTAETSLKNEGITEGMRKAAGFATRAERAEQSLESIAGRGYDTPTLWDQAMAGRSWGAFLQSENGQRYQQAAREWIGSILRYDSGAAVPEEEYWRYFRTYFPQPGDTKETVAQKRASRQGATAELKAQSGGAYETYFPEGARKPATNSGRTKSGWTYEKMP